MRLIHSIIIVTLVFALFSACEESPLDSEDETEYNPEQSEKLVASADSLVAEMIKAGEAGASSSDIMEHITALKDLYQEAAKLDPDNSMANFGAAIFTFQNLLNNPDIQVMQQTLETWAKDIENLDFARYYITQYFMFGNDTITQRYQWVDWDGTVREEFWDYHLSPENAFFGLLFLVQNSLSNPNTIALVQDIIDKTLIATLDEAITYMHNVLKDNSFVYTFDPNLTGEDISFEFDLGEVYLMNAYMHLARANFRMMSAYHITLPGIDSTMDLLDMTTIFPVIKSQDENDGSFLKLRNNTILPSVKDDLLDVISMIENGVSFIKSETDNQMNDLIKQQDLTKTDQEIDSEFTHTYINYVPVPVLRDVGGILDLADAVETMLTGPFDIEIPTETGIETISINISALLNNGIPDIKDVLPKHEWVDLNTLSKGFYGPGCYGWQTKIDGQTVYITWPHVIEVYVSAVNQEVWEYAEYYGSFSTDGIFTVQGKYNWSSDTIEEISPGAMLTSDGAFYLDNQKQLCITEQAYNLINSYIADLPNDDWIKIEIFMNLSLFPKYNFSLEHPYGVRASSGVFKFAGTPEYFFDHNEPVYLIDSQGNPLDPSIQYPVFPDPTFGGVLPGMTQAKLQEFMKLEQ